MGIDLTKIKLLIWDLDETFWDGILSDHTAKIRQENIQLIKDTTDAGVINSICSKNDESEVNQLLKKYEINDLFVFKSSNWTPKGERVKQIINEMNLRPVNVLMLDDNLTNLAEIEHSCPEIQTATEKIIPELISFYSAAPKKDKEHKRLQQYHVLEEKQKFKSVSGSNEEFLRGCNIEVRIKNDCENHLKRIEDLVQRSNQLNFTKNRASLEEIKNTISDSSISSGYVEVNDKFGDYGIVGFYAIKDNRLQHFVFSCRTLNMGVEQYVYHCIGCPQLSIVGDVSSSLAGEKPDWINSSHRVSDGEKENLGNGKVLIKGLCDMQQMFAFIKESKNIITEFVYVNNKGISIEQGAHTAHIVESCELSNEEKQRLVDSVPFGDKGMFETDLYNDDMQYIVLSMLVDPNLGMYREKSSGSIIAFGEFTNDLTDESIWDELIEGKRFTANCPFDKETLRNIKAQFEFLGRINPEGTIKNLDYIYRHISKNAVLILLLGSEIPYENNTQTAYFDREIYHKQLHSGIAEWMKDKDRVRLLDVNKYLTGQQDFTNNINHFTKRIYYELSKELINIINAGEAGEEFRLASESEQKRQRLIRKLKRIPSRIARIAGKKK